MDGMIIRYSNIDGYEYEAWSSNTPNTFYAFNCDLDFKYKITFLLS